MVAVENSFHQKDIQRKSENSITCSCSECDSILCYEIDTENCDCCSNLFMKTDKRKNHKELTAIYLKAARSLNARRACCEKFEALQQNDFDKNFETDRENIFINNRQRPISSEAYIKKILEKTLKRVVQTKKVSSDCRNIRADMECIKKQLSILKQCKLNKCNSYCKQRKKSTQKKNKSTQYDPTLYCNPSDQSICPILQQLNHKSNRNMTDNNKKLDNIKCKFDIFRILKDVYKICSCKVCECIPTTSVTTNTCKCKPCECSKCTSYRVNEDIEVCSCTPCACPECENKMNTTKTNGNRSSFDCSLCSSDYSCKKSNNKYKFPLTSDIYNLELENKTIKVKAPTKSCLKPSNGDLSYLMYDSKTGKCNGSTNISDNNCSINPQTSKSLYLYGNESYNPPMVNAQKTYSELAYCVEDKEEKDNNKPAPSTKQADDFESQNESYLNNLGEQENKSIPKEVKKPVTISKHGFDRTSTVTNISKLNYIPRACNSGPDSSVIKETGTKKSRSPERSLIISNNQKRNQSLSHPDQCKEAFTTVIGDGGNKYTCKQDTINDKLNQKTSLRSPPTVSKLSNIDSRVPTHPLILPDSKSKVSSESYDRFLKYNDNQRRKIKYQEDSVFMLPKISALNQFRETSSEKSKYIYSLNRRQEAILAYKPICVSKSTSPKSDDEKVNNDTVLESIDNCPTGLKKQFVANFQAKSHFNGRLKSCLRDSCRNNVIKVSKFYSNKQSEETSKTNEYISWAFSKATSNNKFPSHESMKSADLSKSYTNRFKSEYTSIYNNMLCLHKPFSGFYSNTYHNPASKSKNTNDITTFKNKAHKSATMNTENIEVKCSMCKKTILNYSGRQTIDPDSQKISGNDRNNRRSGHNNGCNTTIKKQDNFTIYTSFCDHSTNVDHLQSSISKYHTKNKCINCSWSDKSTNVDKQSLVYSSKSLIISRNDKSTKTSNVFYQPIKTNVKLLRDELSQVTDIKNVKNDKKKGDGKCHGPRCKCSVCRCERCFGDEFINPVPSRTRDGRLIQKGDVLTPSAHWAKIHKSVQIKQQHYTPTTRVVLINKGMQSLVYEKPTASKDMLKALDSMDIYKARKNKTDAGTEPVKLLYDYNTMKFDAFVQCEQWIQDNPVVKNETDENISNCKFTKKINKNKSITSFYHSNSSLGFNHSGYLIQIPKSTTKACLKNILKLNMENEFEIDPKCLSNLHLKCIQSDDNLIYIHSYLSSSTDSEDVSLTSEKRNKKTYFPNTYIIEKDFLIDTEKCKSNKSSPTLIGKSDSSKKINTDYAKYIENNRTKITNKRKKNGRYVKQTHLVKDYQDHNTRNAHSSFTLPNDQLLNLDNTNNSNILSMNEECKRVNKTLNEAKMFYLHTLKLLDTYENAIKELDKVKPTDSSIIKKINYINKQITDVKLNCPVPSSSKTLTDLNELRPNVGNNMFSQKLSVSSLTKCNMTTCNNSNVAFDQIQTSDHNTNIPQIIVVNYQLSCYKNVRVTEDYD